VLPSGAFIFLRRLQWLSLAGNGLQRLPASLLRGPARLRELHLEGNRLLGGDPAGQINTAVLDDAPVSLERLDLSDCGLNDSALERLNLAGVPALRRLDLARNNLTRGLATC
jgi:Leucine-rich repeat (LRR) protein